MSRAAAASLLCGFVCFATGSAARLLERSIWVPLPRGAEERDAVGLTATNDDKTPAFRRKSRVACWTTASLFPIYLPPLAERRVNTGQ